MLTKGRDYLLLGEVPHVLPHGVVRIAEISKRGDEAVIEVDEITIVEFGAMPS